VSRIEGSKLVTDLYSKSTDSHQYLLLTSCHLRHCCKNIPHSLALGISRICSQEADYERRTNKLSSHLCHRGYKGENVDKAITKASSIHKHELLKYKSKVTQSRILFVVTYHPDLPKKQNIIDKHWQNTNTKLNQIYHKKPIQTTKKPQSLSRPGKGHTQTGKSQWESRPCKKPRCQTCKLMT